MNMTPDNRPTPITDAAEFSLGDDGAFSKMVVESGVSRTLERRLAEMRKALEKTVRDIHEETGWSDLTTSAKAALKADDALREDEEAGK